MAVGFSNTNKPINPRGQDASPLAYNRAKLYSGKALDFDGVNDLITTPNISVQSSNVWTYTFNFYRETGGGSYPYIFDARSGGGDGYTLFFNPSNLFTFYDSESGSGSRNIGPVYEFDKWYSIALISDGTNVSLYVNGVFADSVSGFDSVAVSDSLYIAARYSASDFYTGQMANFKIFNTALTAAQVADLYNNPEKVVPTGVDNTALKLWLPMMEGAGTTAYDGSGNGNHGTISGATYVNGVGAPVAQSAVMDWNKGSNLFAQSNDFSQSAWNLKNGTFTQGISDPIGGSQAWSWTATDTDPYIYQQSSVSGTHTMSIYAKGVGSTIGKNFEIRVAQTTQSFVLTSEWQRFELDGSPSNTNLGFEYGNPAVVGDVVYIFGAQFEQASTAGPYTPTLSTAQPNPVLLPQGLTTGRDITGVNLFENVRKQGALNLDGNSWAEVHDNASVDLTDAITLEAWVYWDDASNKGIFGRWHSDSSSLGYYLLYLNSV